MKTLKFLPAFTLLAALFLTPNFSHADDLGKPWVDGFPDASGVNSFGEAYVGATEVALGAISAPIGNLIKEIGVKSPEAILEERKAAGTKLRASHPEMAAAIDRSEEMDKLNLIRSKRSLTMEELSKRGEIGFHDQRDTNSLKLKSLMKAEINAMEFDEWVKKPGVRPIFSTPNSHAVSKKLGTAAFKTVSIGGILYLMVDGGAKIALALQHKDGGYAPLITSRHVPLKTPVSKSAEAEQSGGDTSMTAE